MSRETSIETYHEIKRSGLLSARRFEVYKTVFSYGPMTSAEAFAQMIEGQTIRTITQSRARFTELREMGVLKELGTQKCTITGREAILWSVTGNMPKKIKVKGKTKKQKIDGTLEELRGLYKLTIAHVKEKEIAWVKRNFQLIAETIKNI